MKEDSRITGFWDLRQISALAQQKVITVPLTLSKIKPSWACFPKALASPGASKVQPRPAAAITRREI